MRGGFKHPPKTPTTSPAHSEQPAALQPRDTLCSHSQPIKLAMQNDGVQITHQPGSDVQANCQADSVKLALMFGPTTASPYVERHDIDRSYHDPKTALLCCAACNSRLSVVHADTAPEKRCGFQKVQRLRTSAPDVGRFVGAIRRAHPKHPSGEGRAWQVSHIAARLSRQSLYSSGHV